MIYVLSNPSFPARGLIGTAPWIAEARRSFADKGLMTERHRGLDGYPGVEDGRVAWFRHLGCVGMLPGDEAEAERLRDSLWGPTRDPEPLYFTPLFVRGEDLDRWQDSDPDSTPWRVLTPEFLTWLEANAAPWDGSEAETLGIKGLGKARPKPAPCPPARASTIAERMARRRTTKD